MVTTTNLIELLTDAKKNNIGIGECWNLMDEAADLLEAQAKQIEVSLQPQRLHRRMRLRLEKSKQIEELRVRGIE
jgi:hypothetical protein